MIIAVTILISLLFVIFFGSIFRLFIYLLSRTVLFYHSHKSWISEDALLVCWNRGVFLRCRDTGRISHFYLKVIVIFIVILKSLFLLSIRIFLLLFIVKSIFKAVRIIMNRVVAIFLYTNSLVYIINVTFLVARIKHIEFHCIEVLNFLKLRIVVMNVGLTLVLN
jgi:hypothetical protein